MFNAFNFGRITSNRFFIGKIPFLNQIKGAGLSWLFRNVTNILYIQIDSSSEPFLKSVKEIQGLLQRRTSYTTFHWTAINQMTLVLSETGNLTRSSLQNIRFRLGRIKTTHRLPAGSVEHILLLTLVTAHCTTLHCYSWASLDRSDAKGV